MFTRALLSVLAVQLAGCSDVPPAESARPTEGASEAAASALSSGLDWKLGRVSGRPWPGWSRRLRTPRGVSPSSVEQPGSSTTMELLGGHLQKQKRAIPQSCSGHGNWP